MRKIKSFQLFNEGLFSKENDVMAKNLFNSIKNSEEDIKCSFYGDYKITFKFREKGISISKTGNDYTLSVNAVKYNVSNSLCRKIWNFFKENRGRRDSSDLEIHFK